jgi:large subunit ribosomal protein L4
MIEIEVRDRRNNVTGTVGLPETVFGNAASEAVVHAAVVGYLANQRQGTHATKTTSMVSGGGKKPWRQKHTGRARHGTIRSPIWRGGGTTFGPQPRDYSMKLPKQMRRVALYRALSMKLADGQVMALDTCAMDRPRTREVVQMLKDLGLTDKTVLLVLPEKNETVMLSARNIPGVGVIRVGDLNAYHAAAYDKIVFTVDALASFRHTEEEATS